LELRVCIGIFLLLIYEQQFRAAFQRRPSRIFIAGFPNNIETGAMAHAPESTLNLDPITPQTLLLITPEAGCVWAGGRTAMSSGLSVCQPRAEPDSHTQAGTKQCPSAPGFPTGPEYMLERSEVTPITVPWFLLGPLASPSIALSRFCEAPRTFGIYTPWTGRESGAPLDGVQRRRFLSLTYLGCSADGC
jgi:hypothetical protein